MYIHVIFLSICSFNRYMVECELWHGKCAGKLLAVLIDTWWNVNTTFFRPYIQGAGFNRYMVECELIFQQVAFLSKFRF